MNGNSLKHRRPISVTGILANPSCDQDWKNISIKILNEFLTDDDSFSMQTSSQILKEPTCPGADVFLWLEDRPGCHSLQDYYQISSASPLALQVVVTGPWSSGSRVAGSGRSGRTLDSAIHLSWIQLPYQWHIFRSAWNRENKTIWNFPATSSNKEHLIPLSEPVISLEPIVQKTEFLIQSTDDFLKTELRETIHNFGFSKNFIVEGNQLEADWEEEAAEFSQECINKKKTVITIRCGKELAKRQSRDSRKEKAREEENPQHCRIDLVDFAESQIQPDDWLWLWKTRTHLMLGKPFHSVELQSAISYLCF